MMALLVLLLWTFRVVALTVGLCLSPTVVAWAVNPTVVGLSRLRIGIWAFSLALFFCSYM